MGFFSNPIKTITDPIGAATGGSVLDYIPGIGDKLAAERQNAANYAASQKQMDFQERMSNTAYQRAMSDMKAAGLNPMLAFSQGGASTPSGALPAVNNTSGSKLGEMALSAATGFKGLSIQQQNANTQQTQAVSNVALQNSQSAKNVADTQRTLVETQKAKQDLPKGEFSENVFSGLNNAVKAIPDLIRNSAREIQMQRTNSKNLDSAPSRKDRLRVPKPH